MKKSEPTYLAGDLIVCETMAAVRPHLRRLTAAGPKFSGGADSPTLCGLKAAWDTKIPVEPGPVGLCGQCDEARHG